MTQLILAVGFVAVLVLSTEFFWRKGFLAPEIARKIIHVAGGTWIAFWPFFMSYRTLQLLSLALFIGIALSYYFRVFGSIHSVKRSTRGELFYPIGIAACALLTPPSWIFAAAILHLAIADGLAALIGVKWGGKTQYKFLNQTKSLVGSGAFFLISLSIITTSFALLGGEMLISASILSLVGIAALATAVEHISWEGLDNFTVPLAIVLTLGIV